MLEGYADLDLDCTQVTTCNDLAATCAAGYIGKPSERTRLANGTKFDYFTGCTGGETDGLLWH